jgi:hypothetical protein
MKNQERKKEEQTIKMGLFNKKETKPVAVEPPMKELGVFKDESPVVNNVMQDVATEEEVKVKEEAVMEESKEETEPVAELTFEEIFERLNIIIANLDSRITNLEAAVFRAISGKQ